LETVGPDERAGAAGQAIRSLWMGGGGDRRGPISPAVGRRWIGGAKSSLAGAGGGGLPAAGGLAGGWDFFQIWEIPTVNYLRG